MNVKLLLKVRDHILAHPETYNQANWCGTASCFAGHALLLSGNKPIDPYKGVFGNAAEVLELTSAQAETLFLGGDTNTSPFGEIWKPSFPDHLRAILAAKRIDHFISTGGME